MKLQCSQCKSPLEAMALIEGLVATGGQSFRCSCGYVADGKKIRTALNDVINTKTLADAKADVSANLDRGSRCPCCNQFAKRYARKMSALIARWLIALARTTEGDREKWVHVSDCAKYLGGGSSAARSGDYAKARYWGLIESSGELKGDENSAGKWRLTELGWAFVKNEAEVHEKVLVYDSKPIGLDGKKIRITDALGKKFSYAELLGVVVESKK